ncbi:hypothetical protein [Aeromonas hydrophila]
MLMNNECQWPAQRSIKQYRLSTFLLLLGMVCGAESWAETVTPTHLNVQASLLSQRQLEEWGKGGRPEVLSEQVDAEYFRLTMTSVQDGQEYPVLGRILLADEDNHSLLFPLEKSRSSDALGHLIRWGIEFSPLALTSLSNGSYTLQLPLSWPLSGIDRVLFNVELSGFEGGHRLEMRAESDKWDISTLFSQHAQGGIIDIPLQICLDARSTSFAELSIQTETIMTNQTGDKLPYQLALQSDKNDRQTSYLDAVLTPEKPIEISPLRYQSEARSSIENPCHGYLFRLSAQDRHTNIATGHYSQTLFLTLSQDV